MRKKKEIQEMLEKIKKQEAETDEMTNECICCKNLLWHCSCEDTLNWVLATKR